MTDPRLMVTHHLRLSPRNQIKLEGKNETSVGIFHYTDYKGLLGIVESKEIWATHVHYLNDYTEFRSAFKIARHFIQSKMYSEKSRPILDQLEQRLLELENANVFVASFTEHCDALSQWRGYAHGSGVSIGFQYDQLLEIAASKGFRIVKCIYEDFYKMQIINAIINVALEDWHGQFTRDIPPGDSTALKIVDRFVREFLLIAPSFKDEGFIEEKEWRIVSPIMPDICPNVHYRVSGSSLVPYTKFTLLPNMSNKVLKPIKIVMVGPRQDREQQTLAYRAITNLLPLKKIDDCLVQCSKIPYRISI